MSANVHAIGAHPASAHPEAEHAGQPHQELSFLRKYVFSTDHKVIGKQFLFSSLFFFVVGGLAALLVRTQLAWPFEEIPIVGQLIFSNSDGIMPPSSYVAIMTMHGTLMIFFMIIPILSGAFGNFLIPLMIGAEDMAFPKLNMASYWVMWPAFILILLSFFVETGSAAAGWTSYAPLSSVPPPGFLRDGMAVDSWSPGSGVGQTIWIVSLIFVGTASIMGAINYITTISTMRAPGLTMFRLPLTIWALFITAILVTLATPVLTAALIMLLLDRILGTVFFTAVPGEPLLWQHIFWFYSHPAVYIMILPAMGMVSDIIATFARKPVFGYKPMVYSIAGIAVLGFIVWGHHMFQSGMNPVLGMAFMTSTMLIALPSGVKVFNWLSTLWGGQIHLNTAMLMAVTFVAMFIIGGLSGIFMAATPVDVAIHDTYFIVAHLHYVLFGGSMFGVFAGIYYWFPKMFGRMMNERWGKVHWLLTFIGFNAVFFPMHFLGTNLMPRRLADPYIYDYLKHLQPMNQFMTYSAYLLGFAGIVFFINFFYSLRRGPVAERNPWHSNTLEWAAASPPPHGNFETPPTVYRGPYEYAVPGAALDYMPQFEPGPDPQASHAGMPAPAQA